MYGATPPSLSRGRARSTLKALTQAGLTAEETALVRGELAALGDDIRRLAGFCSACQATSAAGCKLKKCRLRSICAQTGLYIYIYI